MIEATREHSFGKRDKVRRGSEVPELVHPESPRVADTSLDLVDNHVDS